MGEGGMAPSDPLAPPVAAGSRHDLEHVSTRSHHHVIDAKLQLWAAAAGPRCRIPSDYRVPCRQLPCEEEREPAAADATRASPDDGEEGAGTT
jgi:hypothetical protein